MVDRANVEQAARVFTDENGNEFVGVPKEVWNNFWAELELVDKRKKFRNVLESPIDFEREDWLNQLQTRSEQMQAIDLPQKEKISMVLDWMEQNPDDSPPEWWDEFRQFLKENRVHFPERNINWGDDD